MNILPFSINFYGKPENYGVIDKYLSRSAQPKKNDFKWLKQQGVTDIFNFRTRIKIGITFNEEDEVKRLGLKYHPIPSITKYPSEDNIIKFLKEVDSIKQSGGKAHIHCMAGADRTGMYSFIYKMVNRIGTLAENRAEWLKYGLHTDRYPNLMQWSEMFISKILNKK